MELFLLIAICSLLTANSNAQTCGSITGPELGSTDAPATTGLIAEVLGEAVQLLQFRIACEVTAGSRGAFSEVSVVAEYVREGSTSVTQAQLEFGCVAGQWATVSGQAFTTPPDIDNILFTLRRRDCYRCISPNAFGSSAPGNNHCLDCSLACIGLEQCTSSSSAFDCCNYYNPDGSCTLSCQDPFQPLSDNTCGCPPGFTGPLCDIPVCSPNPCMNSGTCSSTSSTSSGFSCACSAEYTGVMCEIPLNPCTPTICANGGTCTLLAGVLGGFECNCPAGFEGNTCQNDVNECADTPSPCLNGGTCSNAFGSYVCSCQGQWEGQNCERCGISNCTTCSTDGTACMNCDGGFFISENACSPVPGPVVQCILDSCETCSADNLACEQCESGFIVGTDRLCVRGTSRDINLADFDIIAIVVGCSIGLILIVALVACCLAWTCKSIFEKGPHYVKKQKTKKIVRKTKSRSKVQQTAMVNKDMEVGGDGYENTEGGDLTLF